MEIIEFNNIPLYTKLFNKIINQKKVYKKTESEVLREFDIEKWASETPTLDKIAYNPKNSDKNLNFMQIINDLYEKIEFLDKKVENLYRFVRK